MEFNYGILNMVSNFENDSSKFFQTVFYGSQWPNLEPHAVKMRVLEPTKNGINDNDIIYCAVSQIFGAGISIH